MEEPGLISVRTQVVLDTLVGSIADAVETRLGGPIDPAAERALEALGVDRRLVRMGYLARAEEVERFERAREPMPWLAERLPTTTQHWSDAVASLATALAAAEPLERPDPGDERAVSWRVPGPGGHVRHYLAMRAASEQDGRVSAEAKRFWLAGFLVHCIGEAAPPQTS